jgi:hypothetical protein
MLSGVVASASAMLPPAGRVYINPVVVAPARMMISLPSGEMSAAVIQSALSSVVTSWSVVVPLLDCGYGARYTCLTGSRLEMM